MSLDRKQSASRTHMHFVFKRKGQVTWVLTPIMSVMEGEKISGLLASEYKPCGTELGCKVMLNSPTVLHRMLSFYPESSLDAVM